MTVDLARTLRDHGFPQVDSTDPFQMVWWDDRPFRVPSLGALIAACGADFVHLARASLPVGGGRWEVALSNLRFAYGELPDEACAFAWLRLHPEETP